MADFIHLHTHSEFSLLDGLGKLDLLIAKAKKLGMDSLAITDHGAMYGSFKFYLKALEAGIKPILGVETYVARRNHTDKEGKMDTDPFHLVLLAQNETGYRNLMRIVTIAHLEGYYYKPRIDFDVLKKHYEGVIVLSGCLKGEVAQALLANKEKEAEAIATKYRDLLGPEHYYLEIQRHPQLPETEIVTEKTITLAKKLGIPLVATNDVHYVNADDAEAQDILLCIQTQHTVLEKGRPLSMINCPDYYFKTPDEMSELFADVPEAIENTKKIADRCSVTLDVAKWQLPQFPVPEGETQESYLKKLIYERLDGKYPNASKEIRDRIEYEFSIIASRGYAAYFLIVQDFVNWAKTHGVGVGPGRGSAAGSAISYVLNITGLDPFYFRLPFERFLNPERPSPPDIDLDFADDKRDEVIAYVTAKYGADRVAQIITFGTMEARAAIRDAGRALGMPYSKPDRIARMIPPGFQGSHMTLEKALEMSPELTLAYKTEKDTKKLIDVAKKLEGVARHASVHAAGVVIGARPLVEYTPLQRESKGERVITQYDMYTVGESGVGLMKMDFLGLRNLTIMTQALFFIKQVQNKDVDLTTIPLDDKKTYELLSNAETTGIFQLESGGMRRYIKELKPTTIFDLMAMVALYRPGPMLVIPEFIKRKHDPSAITFPDPRLKEVLSQSYGLIAYQDDVLLTAITLAGYSWGDADKLRKAVGKKIASEMKKQREKFIHGCVANGLTEKKAEDIFNLIEPFAGYGFNKAHAACYAVIAYQTAYLKANFPVEYMTAVITAESRANTGPLRDEKIATIISECKKMNIPLVLPDINVSDVDFTIGNGAILFGLSAIKNVGTAAIESIVSTRKKNGPFKSFADFIARVDTGKVNKKVLESLIKCGATALFGNRNAQLMVLAESLDRSHKDKRSKSDGQSGLFDVDEGEIAYDTIHLPVVPDVTETEKLNFEKELLGFYVSAHPLNSYGALFEERKFLPIGSMKEDSVGKTVKIGGLVAGMKKIITKSSNSEMAFLKLEDLTGSIEVVVFPKTYAKYAELCNRDKIIEVQGRIGEKDDRVTLIADSLTQIVRKTR